jgi:hypothetical protein
VGGLTLGSSSIAFGVQAAFNFDVLVSQTDQLVRILHRVSGVLAEIRFRLVSARQGFEESFPAPEAQKGREELEDCHQEPFFFSRVVFMATATFEASSIPSFCFWSMAQIPQWSGPPHRALKPSLRGKTWPWPSSVFCIATPFRL